ncbi:zinc ribbon domain-containing protein [uncultured Methanobrevibacter sp.]|uniref:zinc ribbon domain-containing protein n=1 Tax=uncultured Methanobrevibacter sp. TaxID=253161 RepID=UPI0025F604F4|nr:zinc ribbon domain-containing protein [uncultured Methanobrevibacter sp.]
MKGFNYCINCGSKLDPSDNFCPNCGVKLEEYDSMLINDDDFFLKYEIKIDSLNDEYEIKMNRAIELIKKQFGSSKTSYSNFISTINESNNVFYNNVEVARDIIRLSDKPSLKIKNELDNKIDTLNSIIDKLEEFIDELIIHSASETEKDVENLTKELDDLINSVKDY